MGVTEEGTSMINDGKNKAGLPDKKVMGLFSFAKGLQSVGILYGSI